MIKNFFKKHSIHKKVVKQFDWLFAFNLPKFFILAAIFSWGMASAYFQVNSSYLSYFNTNFNYSDIVIYIGFFLLLGGLNIQSELDKLKYTFESTKKEYVSDNNNLSYPILASYILNVHNLKKFSIISIFLGIFIISLNSVSVIPTLLLYSYLNLFIYKIIIKKNSYIQNVLFSISSNFFLFISGWIYKTASFTQIIEYIPIYLLAVTPIILTYEHVYFEQFEQKSINTKVVFSISALMLISVFCITYFLNMDPIISHFALIVLPFYFFALFRGLPKDFIRSFIYPIMVINILLSWTLFPYLFMFILLNFYICKYYYWHRFDIHFPKFTIEENS